MNPRSVGLASTGKRRLLRLIWAILGAICAAPVVWAQGPYYIRFDGAPSTIACSNTQIAADPGITLSWNLPANNFAVNGEEFVNGATIGTFQFPLPTANGQMPLSGTGIPFAATPFPFTWKQTLTPVAPDVPSSSFQFLCPGPIGQNFIISNGQIQALPIPTLSFDAMVLLTAMLLTLAVSIDRLRPRSSRTQVDDASPRGQHGRPPAALRAWVVAGYLSSLGADQ
jgi:hypothetical protein